MPAMLALLQAGVPVSNLPFIVAAFVITGAAFLAYGLFLFRRKRDLRREIRELEDAALADRTGETGRQGSPDEF